MFLSGQWFNTFMQFVSSWRTVNALQLDFRIDVFENMFAFIQHLHTAWKPHLSDIVMFFFCLWFLVTSEFAYSTKIKTQQWNRNLNDAVSYVYYITFPKCTAEQEHTYDRPLISHFNKTSTGMDMITVWCSVISPVPPETVWVHNYMMSTHKHACHQWQWLISDKCR